ncbi:MAG: DNA polymerase III subunit beta [Candidatus Kerfeldbacteria bacterium]
MKFSCTQENLNRGLGAVSHITSRNVNLPILNNILIEAKDEGIEFAATNLEIGVRVRVRGKVESTGSFTVPAQVFASYVSLLSAERVDIERDETSLFIAAGNQNTKIKGEESSEFPLIPEVDKKIAITIPSLDFREALNQALVAVSSDDSRPELTGVLFRISKKELILASTDSYRLAERKITLIKEAPMEKQVIIPGAALQELVRVLQEGDEGDVELYLSDSQALFVAPDVEITTKLIEGTFPDYEQIIPKQEHTKTVVDRAELVKAAKAASLFSKSGIHDLNMHFSPEKQVVTLTTVNNQVGENVSKVEAEITGDSNNIIFNYRYLLDGANQIPTKKMAINLIDNVSPGIIQPHGEDESGQYLYIIMPIKQ